MNYRPITVNKGTIARYNDTGFDTLNEQGLLSRALSQGWPISEQVKQEAIESCQRIINNPDSDPSLKQKAIANIIKMDRNNISILQTIMPKQHIHRDVRDIPDEDLDLLLQKGIIDVDRLRTNRDDGSSGGTSETTQHNDNISSEAAEE